VPCTGRRSSLACLKHHPVPSRHPRAQLLCLGSAATPAESLQQVPVHLTAVLGATTVPGGIRPLVGGEAALPREQHLDCSMLDCQASGANRVSHAFRAPSVLASPPRHRQLGAEAQLWLLEGQTAGDPQEQYNRMHCAKPMELDCGPDCKDHRISQFYISLWNAGVIIRQCGKYMSRRTGVHSKNRLTQCDHICF